MIYYPHYAYTGDMTHVSQACVKSSDARVNVGLSWIDVKPLHHVQVRINKYSEGIENLLLLNR